MILCHRSNFKWYTKSKIFHKRLLSKRTTVVLCLRLWGLDLPQRFLFWFKSMTSTEHNDYYSVSKTVNVFKGHCFKSILHQLVTITPIKKNKVTHGFYSIWRHLKIFCEDSTRNKRTIFIYTYSPVSSAPSKGSPHPLIISVPLPHSTLKAIKWNMKTSYDCNLPPL